MGMLIAINGFTGTNQSGLRFKDITRSFNADSLKSRLLRGNDQFANKSVKDYKTILDQSPYFSGTDVSNSYKITLPTTIHAEVDYMIGKGFALNAAGQFTTNKKSTFALYYYNAYSVTPRWENNMFSIELPMSYNELTQFNAGVMVTVLMMKKTLVKMLPDLRNSTNALIQTATI